MIPNQSAVVLAGGASRRMGQDKRLLAWDTGSDGIPRTLLQAVVDLLAELVDEVVVVANDTPDLARARLVRDAFPGSGSLGGIYSGLAASRHESSFVTAADMPFLNPELIRRLCGLLGSTDGVVPIVDKRPEPLHAVYRQTTVAAMRRRIEAGNLKISPMFDELSIVWVNEAELRTIDPTLQSFQNVNTPEDYDTARRALRNQSVTKRS